MGEKGCKEETRDMRGTEETVIVSWGGRRNVEQERLRIAFNDINVARGVYNLVR